MIWCLYINSSLCSSGFGGVVTTCIKHTTCIKVEPRVSVRIGTRDTAKGWDPNAKAASRAEHTR